MSLVLKSGNIHVEFKSLDDFSGKVGPEIILVVVQVS